MSYDEKLNFDTVSYSEQCRLIKEAKLKPKEYPSKFYFKTLKREKSVKFDKYLMLLENRNDFLTATYDNSYELTPIPNFIAFLILLLREKFENELKQNYCFIENNSFPDKDVIQELAENIYLNCDEYKDVVEVADDATAVDLFFVLLNYLHQLEQFLIQASRETIRYIRENPIFKYIRPRDFVIMNQIQTYVSTCIFSKGPTLITTKDETNIKLKDLEKLVKHYYFGENLNRIDEIIRRNKLHQLFYKDMRQLRSTTHRYLMRFVLRNCLYMIRRYVCFASSKLRKLRGEDPRHTNTCSVPFISCFATYRMAQFLAATITEVRDMENKLEDRINYLMNIFSIHMENIWFRQELISKIETSTEAEHCHENCPCGI